MLRGSGDPRSLPCLGNLRCVTPKGPNPEGGGPEDEGAGEHERQDGHDDGAEGEALKGWLPPEDRLWLHPSELPVGAPPPAPGVPAGQGKRPGDHRRRDLTTTIGVVGAAVAVVIGVFFLVETGMGSGPPSSLDTTVTSFTLGEGCCSPVPPAARTAAAAMVALSVTTRGDVAQSCGVAVMGGGLVATLADAVRGATSITATMADGQRESARLVATDTHSDIALLRVSGDLSAAQFADDATERTDAVLMVMAMAPRHEAPAGSAPGTAWATTTLRSIGLAVRTGDASGMAALDVSRVNVPVVPGEILVSPDGLVVGLLDASGDAGAPGSEVFLPSNMVVAVSSELAVAGKVRHGWLGVDGSDVPHGGGAVVASVAAHGPSAGALKDGDVIVAVNGDPVRSVAELRSRLYVLAPGTVVRIEVRRSGEPVAVGVTLSSSP